ncbi:nucleotidyltransferase domain-containing protein [Clostridium sp. YIM B02505]|uniref:Nucleotidyltransferase domain-containing protein n=1 Tax=Clostridium yunnanense TaxID=2800325 RepID=A0ABS1EIZ8_9CLOT|nr:nucleotidyltransferase domain-containing protein [Clostridium yunnanense]MBK1809344.1 nucleotidyltransferase domain-containing protein [Clostridium yunnanense]
MTNEILRYQKVFTSVIERLRENQDILAVMAFGSMVTGDLWEGSDIDIFVILKEQQESIRNIYTEENGISVHMKLLSKENFLNFYQNNVIGGYMHRILISSKLIFSKDEHITNVFNSFRYINDSEREKWNLVYLGDILKDISHCKKLIANSNIKSAYLTCMRTVENFASLFLNFNGYLVSKDVISVAINLDDNFNVILDELVNASNDLEAVIYSTLNFVEGFLEKNIRSCCSALIKYLREHKNFMSAEEIKVDVFFKGFNIHMEDILKELANKKIIRKDLRSIKSQSGNLIGEENVYC